MVLLTVPLRIIAVWATILLTLCRTVLFPDIERILQPDRAIAFALSGQRNPVKWELGGEMWGEAAHAYPKPPAPELYTLGGTQPASTALG